MYKLTFTEKEYENCEPFSIWRLATDDEDAAWQANDIAVRANWTIKDIAPDEKEQVLPEQLAGLQRL
tara:strand:- start:361 stop:561 length:201 start_codon:yes stop_codon:yes gene_type:complete